MAEGAACGSWAQRASTPFGLAAAPFVLYAIELACPKETLVVPSPGPGASGFVYSGPWMGAAFPRSMQPNASGLFAELTSDRFMASQSSRRAL